MVVASVVVLWIPSFATALSGVGIVDKLWFENWNFTLTSTSRSTLLVEPPDEVVPQPEDFFIVMIIIIIVNNTILNTITNEENKNRTCDCGHPLVIVTSTSAWQACRSDVLVCGPVQLFRENNDFCLFYDLSGHLEQSEVLIDSVAVVVGVHDDLGDVHPRLQGGCRQ